MTDIDVIRRLGGPAALARRLGYQTQRVNAWKQRGIPSAELLAHPWLLTLKTGLVLVPAAALGRGGCEACAAVVPPEFWAAANDGGAAGAVHERTVPRKAKPGNHNGGEVLP